MNIFAKSIVIIGCICAVPLYGRQEKWSLRECIEYAEKNNLQIKQQQIAVRQAQNNVLQAKLDFIPSFNASVNHNLNWGKSVNINDLQITNQLTQSTSANISASFPIVDGLSKHNTLKSSKTQLHIYEQEVERLKDEISISITQAYLQVLLALEIEKTAMQSCKSTEEQVEYTRKLVNAGSQAYSSLLDIEARLATERVQLVTAGNDVKTNYLTLAQLLDLPQESGFEIEIPDTAALAINSAIDFGTGSDNINETYRFAMDLPQIKSAELSLEKSKYDYKIQKGASYPSISFSAGYGTYYSDSREEAFFTQFDDNRNPSIGFGINIPIFNGWRTNTSIRNARLNVKNAQFELEKARQQLYKEIQQAYNNAQNAYEKYQAARQNMKAGEESYKYVEQKFNVGMLNGTDYTVAKTNLFKAQSEYYQAKYQYVFYLKILDFYRGLPIEL